MRTSLLVSVLLLGCYSSVGLEPYLGNFDGLSVLGFCKYQEDLEASLVLMTQDIPTGTLLTPEIVMKDGSMLGDLLETENFQFSNMEYSPNITFKLKPIEILSSTGFNPSFYSEPSTDLHLVVDVDPSKAVPFLKQFAANVKANYTLTLYYAGSRIEDAEEWLNSTHVGRRDPPPELAFEGTTILLTDREDFRFTSSSPVIVLHVSPSRTRSKALWNSACTSKGEYIYIENYQSLKGLLPEILARLEGVWKLWVESTLPQTPGEYLITGQFEAIIAGKSITFQLRALSSTRDTRGWIVHE